MEQEGIEVRVGRLEENKSNGSYLPHLYLTLFSFCKVIEETAY